MPVGGSRAALGVAVGLEQFYDFYFLGVDVGIECIDAYPFILLGVR